MGGGGREWVCVSPGFINHNAFKMPGMWRLVRPSLSPFSLKTGLDGVLPQLDDKPGPQVPSTRIRARREVWSLLSFLPGRPLS